MLHPIAYVKEKRTRLPCGTPTEARVGQRFAADFRHHLPSGYFLINWRVASPKFRASHMLEVGFGPNSGPRKAVAGSVARQSAPHGEYE
jgi:hypothetical protein